MSLYLNYAITSLGTDKPAIRIYDMQTGITQDIVPLLATDCTDLHHVARVAFADWIAPSPYKAPSLRAMLGLLVAIPASLYLWAFIVWIIAGDM